MCEHLANLIGDQPDHFFLIGILSSLDSILDISLEDALKQLPLAPDIASAILNKEGLAGEALKCVINYEHWEIQAMTFKDLDQKSIGEAYVKSINWAKDILGNLN